MTKFRPCIDLHSGQVKQIVGGTLTDTAQSDLKTNFVANQPAGHFARLYSDHGLVGGHVVKLGPGNEEAAKEALNEYRGKLHIAGGITDENAKEWINAGAEKVVVTSYLFPESSFSQARLEKILSALDNDKSKLVIDLSCRRRNDTFFVAMNRWQTLTDMEITEANIKYLERHCSEFLVHAVDNEGLQNGIETLLIERLAKWCSIPVTYAGGASSITDLEKIRELSSGKIDLTIGSALDIFGGKGVTFAECIEWNKKQGAA